MAESVEVGSAYLSLVASAKGIKSQIIGEIGGDMTAAGKDAGKSLAKGITSSAEQGLRSSADQMAAAVAAGQAKVEAASRSLTAQRNKEADAAGLLRVAETRLQELQESGKATGTQLAAASEKVAAAQRKLETQERQTVASTKALQDAQKDSAKAVQNLGQETAQAAPQLAKAEQGTDGLSRGMGGVAKAAGAALAAVTLAAAGIGSAIASAMDTQDAKAKMSAQLGLMPDAAARYGKMSGEVFAEAYGDSLGQVNEAMVKVTQNISGGSDAWMKTTTKNVLSVAKAFDEDLGGVTRAVGQMMRNNLAKDAGEALDIITAGMQNGANKSQDLLDTMNEYSTMFRDLGISGKVALGLITQGLEAGARDADTVADTLKEVAIRSQDASTTSADGFKRIGLNAKEMTAIFAAGGPRAAEALDQVLDGLRNMEDPVERNRAAVELFGTKAEDLGDALFALDPTYAVDALGKVDGAAQRVNDTLGDTASSKIEAWKRTIQQNVVNYITETVVPFFQDLASKINLGDLIREVKIKIAEFRAMIQTMVSDVRKWAAEHRTELEALKKTAIDTLDTLKVHIQDVTAVMKFIWDNFGENIFTFLVTKLQALLEMVSGIMTGLRGIFETVFGFLTGDTDLMLEGLKHMFQGGLEFIEGFIDTTLGSIVALFGGNWQEVKDNTVEAWNNLRTFVSNGVENIKSVIHGIAEIPSRFRRWWYEILVNIAEVHGEIISFVRNIPAGIVAALGNLPSLLWNAGQAIIGGLIGGLRSKTGELFSYVQTLAPAIAALKGPLSYDRALLQPAGKAIIGGLISGMMSMETQLYGYVSNIGNKIAIATGSGNPSLNLSADMAGGAGATIINVYGSDGQSVESLATAVSNKQRTLGRL